MLRRLTFWILQAFHTCKDHFNSYVFWCVTIWPLSTNNLHTPNMLYVSVWSETGQLCLCLCLLSKTLFNAHLFTILLYLISAPAGLTSWMTSRLHSYVSLEVLYIFFRVPTNIWLLVDVQTYVSCWCLLGSTISLW